jgi:hypothetical protein
MVIDVSEMCCSRFADFLCSRRERGMAIIPIVSSSAPLSFLLCFRALSAEDSGETVGTGSVRVQTACMVGILHCPWCGADLRRFYSNRADELPLVNIGSEVITGPEQVFALADKGVLVCHGP